MCKGNNKKSIMMKKYNIVFNTNYYVIRIWLYFKYEKNK